MSEQDWTLIPRLIHTTLHCDKVKATPINFCRDVFISEDYLTLGYLCSESFHLIFPGQTAMHPSIPYSPCQGYLPFQMQRRRWKQISLCRATSSRPSYSLLLGSSIHLSVAQKAQLSPEPSIPLYPHCRYMSHSPSCPTPPPAPSSSPRARPQSSDSLHFLPART